MAETSTILKYALLVFNVLVGIIGVVALILTIYMTVYTSQLEGFSMSGADVFLMWLWLITFAIFGLAGLGAYGSCRKKRTHLIVFCVLMWIITVIMVCNGISYTVVIQKFKSSVSPRQREDFNMSFSLILGLSFGTAAFTALGGILSKLMVNHLK